MKWKKNPQHNIRKFYLIEEKWNLYNERANYAPG